MHQKGRLEADQPGWHDDQIIRLEHHVLLGFSSFENIHHVQLKRLLIAAVPARIAHYLDLLLVRKVGKAAGAQTLGVLCGFGQESELRQAGADVILASTAQCASVLLPQE